MIKADVYGYVHSILFHLSPPSPPPLLPLSSYGRASAALFAYYRRAACRQQAIEIPRSPLFPIASSSKREKLLSVYLRAKISKTMSRCFERWDVNRFREIFDFDGEAKAKTLKRSRAKRRLFRDMEEYNEMCKECVYIYCSPTPPKGKVYYFQSILFSFSIRRHLFPSRSKYYDRESLSTPYRYETLTVPHNHVSPKSIPFSILHLPFLSPPPPPCFHHRIPDKAVPVCDEACPTRCRPRRRPLHHRGDRTKFPSLKIV